MFNPIIKKNYFNKYDLSIFKKKKFRTHVFGMGGSSLSTKLLSQFLNPYNLGKKLFIYENPSPVVIIDVPVHVGSTVEAVLPSLSKHL